MNDLTVSLEAQERARRLIPGMTQLLSKRPDQFSAGVWPGYFQEAKGAEVWDLDGNRYLDMSISAVGATVLGYADADVDSAVIEAIRRGVSSSLNCEEEIVLADRMVEIHSWADMVRFARTGGEAMAIAVRIARARTGRETVAFCGYHGWHDWYLAANLASGHALDGQLLPGLEPNGVPRGLMGTALPFKYNRLDELESIIAAKRADLAAIVMEPIRDHEPDPGFLEGVRALADAVGAVLIFDEISSGFRLVTGGAHLVLGVNPDVAVFSKALGNGYAIAAVIGRAEVMEAAQTSFISSTNWTERIGPSAALAVLEKHGRLNVATRLNRLGTRIQAGWIAAGERHDLPVSVSGIPALSKLRLHVEEPLVLKSLYVQLMLERGFLASTLYYAMYAHTDDHVDQYLKAVDEVFEQMSDSLRSGRSRAALRGQPAVAGFGRLA